jgi:hypothetical protein
MRPIGVHAPTVAFVDDRSPIRWKATTRSSSTMAASQLSWSIPAAGGL